MIVDDERGFGLVEFFLNRGKSGSGLYLAVFPEVVPKRRAQGDKQNDHRGADGGKQIFFRPTAEEAIDKSEQSADEMGQQFPDKQEAPPN